MTDYDWETGRVATPTVPLRARLGRPGLRSIEEFAALEYPRESVSWILRTAPSTPSAGPPVLPKGTGASKKRGRRTESPSRVQREP